MPTFGGIVVSTGTEAEGRITLAEAAADLARTVNPDDTTVLAIAKDAIRSAVRTLNRKGCWPWEYQEEDVVTTAGSPYVTVTSDIKKPLALHWLTAAGGVEERHLAYVPYDVYREKYTMNVQSDPLFYTVPNMFESGQIRLYPIPNRAVNLRLSFWRVTPAPRNDTETIEVPDWAFEAYMSRAWYEFCKRLPNNQRPMPIQIAMEEFRQAFKELSASVCNADRSRYLEMF